MSDGGVVLPLEPRSTSILWPASSDIVGSGAALGVAQRSGSAAYSSGAVA
jgi:hypothetical protein